MLERLARGLPNPKVELDFVSPWQLLIATILSAQSTDERINQVTPELFRRYPDPAALAAAAQDEVERVVKSTGFFRNKARAIREASRVLVERFGGEVPRTLDALVELPGVARKTANVVLGCAYGLNEGLLVDTHVARVAGRLRLASAEDPEEIEGQLCRKFEREAWTRAALTLQLHGRYLCTARSPACAACPVNELCPSREALPEGPWQDRADALRAKSRFARTT